MYGTANLVQDMTPTDLFEILPNVLNDFSASLGGFLELFRTVVLLKFPNALLAILICNAFRGAMIVNYHISTNISQKIFNNYCALDPWSSSGTEVLLVAQLYFVSTCWVWRWPYCSCHDRYILDLEG